jgi:hypothetical protein
MPKIILQTELFFLLLMVSLLGHAASGQFLTGGGAVSRVLIHPLAVAPATATHYELKLGMYIGETGVLLHVNLTDVAGRMPSIDTIYDLDNGGSIWLGSIDMLIHQNGFRKIVGRISDALPGIRCDIPRVDRRAFSCYLDLEQGYLIAADGSGEELNIEVANFTQSLAKFRNALMGKGSMGKLDFPIALLEKYTEQDEMLHLLDQVDSIDAYQYADTASKSFVVPSWSEGAEKKLRNARCSMVSQAYLGQFVKDRNEQHLRDVLKNTADCSISLIPVFQPFYNLTSNNLQARQVLISGFELYAKKYHSQNAACVARLIGNQSCQNIGIIEKSESSLRPNVPSPTITIGRPSSPTKPAPMIAAPSSQLIDEELRKVLALSRNPHTVFGTEERLMNMLPKQNATAIFIKPVVLAHETTARLALFQRQSSPVQLKYGKYKTGVNVRMEFDETSECIITKCAGSIRTKHVTFSHHISMELSDNNGFLAARDFPAFQNPNQAISIAMPTQNDGKSKDAPSAKVSYSNVVMTITDIQPTLQ